MRKKTIGFLVVLMLPLLTFAQLNKIEFEEFDLDNGLHVILHQDNSTPVVAVDIMYHVGSKNERSDRTGFAHFFEHLMFEGTDNIERGQYFKIVQNAGGEMNAWTTFDKTNYYEVLPSNQLELGLWLESERMLSLVIDTIGVETQRKVVKEERKNRYENQPYGSFLEEMFTRAFPNSPYYWIPIGNAQYIDEAKIKEFQDFHKQFYVPENAVLTIAGDIDPVQTKKLVKAYFGDIPRGTQPIFRPEFPEISQTAEIRDTVYDNIQLPAYMSGYHMPAAGTPDSYALSMLQVLLSKGESSRLYKSLVDNKQVAVMTASVPFSLENGGLFIIYGIGNMGVDPYQMEVSINEEIEKLVKEGIPEKEFQKLQNQVENDFVSGNSTMEGISSSLSDFYTIHRDANLINTEIDKYLAVTSDDIVRVAKDYLTPTNKVTLYYLPKQ